MSRVFIDTGAFVALRHGAEREHDDARRTFRELLASRATLLTSTYVFSETYTVLLVRAGRHEAIKWAAGFRASPTIELLRVDDEIEDAAWSILESHADKSYSHVDATSFALMERHEIGTAFTFDRHFVQHGLTVVPAP